MNVRNPYVLLRVLIAVDVVVTMSGVVLPAFANLSLIDYLDELRHMQLAHALYGYAWLTSIVIMIAAWFGVLLVKPWGRALYALSLVPFLVLIFVAGLEGHGPGLRAVLVCASTLVFGFNLAMFYFGPVAGLFHARRASVASAAPQSSTDCDPDAL